MRRTRLIVVTAAATVAVLAACSNPSLSTVAAPDESAPFNAADVQYLQAAIPAHSEAIAMARLGELAGTTSGVRLLAAQIVEAQVDERDTMVRLLESWGYTVDAPLTEGNGVPELTREVDIQLLGSLEGRAFDAQFLTSMEQHHQRVLSASRNVESTGESSELSAITDLIIRSQAFEVEQIKELRDADSGDAP